MKSRRKIKSALFAAASLTAAGVATGALALDEAVSPPIEEVVVFEEEKAASIATEEAPIARKLALSAAAAAILAALVKLIGVGNLRKAAASAGPAVAKAAKVAVEAPAAAVRAVGSSLSSPLRTMLIFASLGMAAFVGIGFYDVEWLGGLVIGAAMAAMATNAFATGSARVQKALAPIRSFGRSFGQKGAGEPDNAPHTDKVNSN